MKATRKEIHEERVIIEMTHEEARALKHGVGCVKWSYADGESLQALFNILDEVVI